MKLQLSKFLSNQIFSFHLKISKKILRVVKIKRARGDLYLYWFTIVLSYCEFSLFYDHHVESTMPFTNLFISILLFIMNSFWISEHIRKILFEPQMIRVHMFFSFLSILVLTVINNAVKDVSGVSFNSVLNTLRRIRITSIVNGSNVVKRLDAKGDKEIWMCERLDITA